MLAHDLIAEEFRGTRSSMGNQSLFFRKLHFQRFPKKRSDVPFDLLSFCLRATEAKRPIISIPHIAKPAIGGVLRVLAGQFPPLLSQGSNCLPISFSLGAGKSVLDGLIGRVFLPAFLSIVFR